jgi:hypothetical protein
VLKRAKPDVLEILFGDVLEHLADPRLADRQPTDRSKMQDVYRSAERLGDALGSRRCGDAEDTGGIYVK